MLTVTNSTISGNTGGSDGGGVFNNQSAVVDLNNVTVANNFAARDGGGIYNEGPFTVANTLIAGNRAPGGLSGPDCRGSFISQGYNLIQNVSNCQLTGDTTGNVIGQDPRLGVLTDNGGPTDTDLPDLASPLVDGGNPGGFVQFAESGIPPYTSMAAPATFLGDWSSLDGIGSLRYDFRLFSGTPDSTAGIMVTGGFGTSGSMFWRQPVTAGALGWKTVTAPLNQSSWEIQDGTWDAILSSVTEVRIFPDYFDHFGEVTGVDNIALVPEPSPAATVAVALVIFGCACLWRRKRSTK